MKTFSNIVELIRNLKRGDKLLSEMFSKRNSLSFRYDDASEIIENEESLKLLLNYSVIRENGAFLEIDDLFLDFFKQVFMLNEEINTAVINQNIENIKQYIIYYLEENNESRKYDYLRNVKNDLRKIGVITNKNVIDLGKKIDTTFKVEPNFKIKKSKLEFLDKKRIDIEVLIDHTQKLLTDEEFFFKIATDEELKRIITQLKLDLGECGHNLIESQTQIIAYINQIKFKNSIIEKLRKLKYLKDQLMISSTTNIEAVLLSDNALVFEKKPTYPLKLSVEYLQTDNNIYQTIKKIRENAQLIIKAKIPLAGKIEDEYFQNQSEETQQINLEEVKNSFVLSNNNLFEFILSYRFSRELTFDEKVTTYCQVISLYDNEMTITNDFASQQGIEYALVYPK